MTSKSETTIRQFGGSDDWEENQAYVPPARRSASDNNVKEYKAKSNYDYWKDEDFSKCGIPVTLSELVIGKL